MSKPTVVLEEWGRKYERKRLIVTPNGHIVPQWLGAVSGNWWSYARQDYNTVRVPRFTEAK